MTIREEPRGTVARHRTHVDRVEEPEAAYREMYAWVNESRYPPAGDWFVRELYTLNPWDAEPRRVEVEFQVPVREME